MVRRGEIPTFAAGSHQSPLHCTQGSGGAFGENFNPPDSRVIINGILEPTQIPHDNRHTLALRFKKRRRVKKKRKPASRRKRKDRYQGVRIGEAKNPGPPFFKKVADSIPFEVTKVVECIYGSNCHCPTHRHRKKGEMNPAMRRKLAKLKNEGKLEWKPVKYRTCQHANLAKHCDRCASMLEPHYHSMGEEKQAHQSVKLYADCLQKQQNSEIDDSKGQLPDEKVVVVGEEPLELMVGQPQQADQAELELPIQNGDEADLIVEVLVDHKHNGNPVQVEAQNLLELPADGGDEAAAPVEQQVDQDLDHGGEPMEEGADALPADQAEPANVEEPGAGNDPPAHPPPLADPHPEDDGGGDEDEPDPEGDGHLDNMPVAYATAERVISTNLGSRELTGFWTNLKRVLKRVNPLLKEVPNFPDLPGEFSGSIPVTTYNTTHFSYIWKDVDGYNPGRAVDVQKRTEFFNYVRSIYNDHRRATVNMDLLRAILRNDQLLLPKYINADGRPMDSVFARVNFVATKLPHFETYIRRQDVYINTVAYAVNCLTYRYMIMQSSLPGPFKPYFHSGPASPRQR